MKVSIDFTSTRKLELMLKRMPEQVTNAMKNTVRQATTMALEYVKQPNINLPTSYKDTRRIPLKETKKRVYSGMINKSEAFPYFEYGTGTGSSEGAKNGEWFVPVEWADLSKYYPTTRDGRFYRVKPQKAQRMFKKTADLVDRELQPLLIANLKKEIK